MESHLAAKDHAMAKVEKVRLRVIVADLQEKVNLQPRGGEPLLGRWEVLYATANQPLLVTMESKLQPGTIFRRDFIKKIVEVILKC